VVALLGAIALALESSGLDLVAMDALYRAGGGAYVLRNAWWTKNLLHDGGQDVVKAIAVIAALVGLFGKWLPGIDALGGDFRGGDAGRNFGSHAFVFLSLRAIVVRLSKATVA
jgi:membrane-associated PAP2 superfamily phosphatase